MAPQGFSGCQEFSLSLSTSHQTTSLLNSAHAITPCIPHSHPFLPDNPTHFQFSPLGPGSQDLTPPPHHPLSWQRFHSFSGGWRSHYRVNRKGNLCRRSVMATEPSLNTYSECWGSNVRGMVLSHTNY